MKSTNVVPEKLESKVCSHCGYCRECGRGGHQLIQYIPYYPYYPYWYTSGQLTQSPNVSAGGQLLGTGYTTAAGSGGLTSGNMSIAPSCFSMTYNTSS